MEHRNYFCVDKSSRTFADNLVAFGFARLLRELLAQQGDEPNDVVFQDCGAYFRLTTSHPVDSRFWGAAWTRICPARAVRTIKNAATLPAGIPYQDYEADKEQVSLHYAARQSKIDRDDAPPLPPHWDVSRAINPAALPGYNNLVFDWWNLGEHQPLAIGLLLSLFSATPNALADAVDTWKQLDGQYGWGISAETTRLQLYNPDQGKGQNKVKSDGLSIGNVKGFWLIEWLKAVGFYEAAITRQVRGTKDRKTFIVSPRELSHSVSQAVMADFASTMSSETSIKFDVLAAIRYTDALLRHFQQDASHLARLLELRDVQKRVVAGFDTAFYKDLGNAVATLNISFIALPRWVRIESRDDIAFYTDKTENRGLLRQLELLTRQFDESHSDAFALLHDLRDFVSGDDLAAFFRFSTGFSGYYVSTRERGQYAYPMTTEFVERLIMGTNPSLTRILKTEGFQNIAYAIRQSTVTAQFRKQQGDRRYDIRYGLGQELARKAIYSDRFIAALGDFLHKYNAENAQVMETRPGPYRRSVKTTDIEEIVQLIDEYGPETIANLLIAYGYARVPRDDEEPGEEAPQEEISDGTADL